MARVRVSHPATKARALLFASGVAALVYQTVWIKQLSLVVDVEVYAVTIGISGFFAGLAGDAALFGRIADRTSSPFKLYAWIEAGIAVTAVAATSALSAIPDIPLVKTPRGRALARSDTLNLLSAKTCDAAAAGEVLRVDEGGLLADSSGKSEMASPRGTESTTHRATLETLTPLYAAFLRHYLPHDRATYRAT